MIGFILLGFISIVFSADSLSCEIKSGSCASPWVPFFYVNNNFYDTSGNQNNVLSSNVAVASSGNYDKVLCCKSDLAVGNLSTSFEVGDVCPDASTRHIDLLHFTSDTNARVGIRYTSVDSHTVRKPDETFNYSHYNKTLCVKVPDAFSSFDLMANDRDMSSVGYTCMFRTSGLINGLVAACNSTFIGPTLASEVYPYTIWGKLNENDNTMQCNDDCTSKLDNRVYSICGEKILGCEGVPVECDGSLLGAWVYYNGTVEVKCSPDWVEYRESVFSSSSIDVTSASQDCENIIVKKYPVILDNEVVNMRMYICG